jgi:uncharacterized damage-inducible protein DinB
MKAKTVFEALAKYKGSVDESLLGIVEKLSEDRLLASGGAYFPTVYHQLKHIFGSDVNWIKRLKKAFPASAALAASRFADFELESLKAQPIGERAKFFADIREIDRDILSFVSELGDAELDSMVSYVNYKGESESRELWKILLHWFNHGVHHRGTISAQLDSLGIENDYSNLMSRV